MYPRQNKRSTANGDPVYSYVCKIKERSKRSVCNQRNANGNLLDSTVIEQLKLLEEDNSVFMQQLEESRRFYASNRIEYEERLATLKKEQADIGKKIEALVDSLIDISDSTARNHIAKRIEQLNQESIEKNNSIREIEGLVSQHTLGSVEFDVLRQLLSAFKNSVDEMTLEQRRTAIRTLVRRVVWDGTKAHVVLFGAPDPEIAYPPMAKAKTS